MGKSAAATAVIEEAAHIVAYWDDLRTTEPHELRAHLTLGRLCRAFYQALGIQGDWYLRTPWVFAPIHREPLTLVLLVGRVDGEICATMREGAAHDMEQHYSPKQLRHQLEKGDYGVLASWAPWVNAYFLNAIRDALFGLTHSTAYGAAWRHGDETPGAPAVKAARVAIQAADALIPAFRPIESPHLRTFHSRLLPKSSLRSQFIWRRVAQLDVRIPPQNLPLDRLRGRSPPPGMPHKGNALTITEQIIAYLHDELGMGVSAIASALEMEDFRQVPHALDSAKGKRERWKRFIADHGPTRRT